MGTSKKGAVGTVRAARGDRRTKYKDIYLGNARVTACTVAGEPLRFM